MSKMMAYSLKLVAILALIYCANVQAIFTGCGQTKTCLTYFGCAEVNGSSVTNVAAFYETNGELRIQIKATTNGWAAFGISRDRNMIDTEIFLCYMQNGVAQIESRYAFARSQPALNNNQSTFTSESASFIGGILMCNLTSSPITANQFNLFSRYHILLASGSSYFSYHGNGLFNRCSTSSMFSLLTGSAHSFVVTGKTLIIGLILLTIL